MSNPFSSIMDLPKYYKQALRAIEVGAAGSNEPNLFCYQDHFIKHLLNAFLQQKDPTVFCCPQMKHLIECDKKDGRNLAETLYQYLLNGNTAATAAAMFIHRNTTLPAQSDQRDREHRLQRSCFEAISDPFLRNDEVRTTRRHYMSK